MKHIYEGKTKSVFELADGTILLKLKDDVTGEEGRIDPGSNTVMGQLEGMGHASLRMSRYYFELLAQKGIQTHYLDSDLDANTMTVKKAETFGQGLEVICRFKAYGSFIRRYGAYVKPEQELNALVEITLKDDEQGDPLITEEALEQLGLLQPGEYSLLKEKARAVARILQDDLRTKGLDLYDIKFEFGRSTDEAREIMLIDDISGGNMRVFREGQQVEPRELSLLVCEG